MRILFVTSNRLGDAVLSTGLLDHLIRHHPEARITVVCGAVAEGLFACMPNRERTIVLRKKKWGLHWLPLWAEAVVHVWDLVIDIRGSALSWIVPTRRRAVFRRVDGPKIAQLGAMLGLSPPPSPVAWTSDTDRQRVLALLPPDRRFIALAPTANWEPKVWPADRFAAVFRHIAGGDATVMVREGAPSMSYGVSDQQKRGWRASAHHDEDQDRGREHQNDNRYADAVAIVLGGPGETEQAMAAPLFAALPGAIDLVGRLTLPEVVACLERCDLFVGNDSGLMHLAAAAGTPTIGLFGPTDAATYAPTGRLATAVVAQSMDAISVEQVTRAAGRFLGLAS